MRNRSKPAVMAGLAYAMLHSTMALATTPTLTLVNQGDSPMTRVAFAPHNTDRWFSMSGAAVEAGGKVTVVMPGSACVFDVRFRFQDEVTMTVKAWNVCKQPVMEIGRQAAPPVTGASH